MNFSEIVADQAGQRDFRHGCLTQIQKIGPFPNLEYAPKIVFRAATQKETAFEIAESSHVLVVEGIYLDDVNVTRAVSDLRPCEKLGHVGYNPHNVDRS